MNNIHLVCQYREDIEAFRTLLHESKVTPVFLEPVDLCKQTLTSLPAPDLLLFALNAETPSFDEIFAFLHSDTKLREVQILFIVNAGQKHMALSRWQHAIQSNHAFVERPVPRQVLMNAIQERIRQSRYQKEKSSVGFTKRTSSPIDLKMLQERFHSIRFEQEIGRGGAGVVYLGYQTTLRRQVAVKVLLPGEKNDVSENLRLQQEALAIARLKHPNIVQCFDAGFLDQENFYIVMEFIQGEDLGKYLQRYGAMPETQAIHVILQTARGLSAAHEEGIIHRDIKPSNLLMDARRCVTITDFGLAINEGHGRTTKTGIVVGTPHYVSPEQATGGGISAQTDIYSLGVVFYELLTGTLPVITDNVFHSVLQRIQKKDLDPREKSPHISLEISEIIKKMTRQSPQERYASCQDLVQALEILVWERMVAQSQSMLIQDPAVRVSSSMTPPSGFAFFQPAWLPHNTPLPHLATHSVASAQASIVHTPLPTHNANPAPIEHSPSFQSVEIVGELSAIDQQDTSESPLFVEAVGEPLPATPHGEPNHFPANDGSPAHNVASVQPAENPMEKKVGAPYSSPSLTVLDAIGDLFSKSENSNFPPISEHIQNPPSSEEQSAISEEQSDILEEQSDILEEPSAISEEQSAISEEQSAISEEQSAISEEQSAISEESLPVLEEQPPSPLEVVSTFAPVPEFVEESEDAPIASSREQDPIGVAESEVLDDAPVEPVRDLKTFYSTGTQQKVQLYCSQVLKEFPDALACGIVDIDSPLLLGIDCSDCSPTQDELSQIVQLLAIEMFCKQSLIDLEEVLDTPETQYPLSEGLFRSSDESFFMKKVSERCVLVLVTPKWVNQGIGWSILHCAEEILSLPL